MESKSLQPYLFPNLAGGWDPSGYPRSLGPANPNGDLWSQIHNFRAHEGRLRRRSAITTLESSYNPTILFNDNLAKSSLEPIGNAQLPLLIYSWKDEPGGSRHTLVVTTREVHLNQNGIWTVITPVYEVGTVNVTNGSTTVTVASGTPNWLSNGVIPGNLIQLPKGSGAWYRIWDATNTTITLHTAFTGTTIAGGTYSIRRNISPYRFGNVALGAKAFAVLFNDDLYIATPGPIDGSVWVLKTTVSNAFTSGPCSILACSYAIQSGVDVLPGATPFPVCNGLTVLDDGRVVLALTSSDFRSRIYYSSHLNQAVWSTTPAGFTDVTTVEGTLRALGKLGSNLTLHFDRGIALGVPTGQDDPPLAFRPTQTKAGCGSARTLKQLNREEYFVTKDFDVCSFDGVSISFIGEPVKNYLQYRNRARLKIAHAAIDSYRREYHVYLAQDGTDEANQPVKETLRFVYSVDRKAWTKEQFAVLIGAASDELGFYTEGRDMGNAIVGIPSLDPVDGAGTSDMLFKLSEVVTTDASPGFGATGANGGVYATTDDFDCELPGVDKTLSHITVWFFSDTTEAEVFEVGISKDSGTTWTSVQVTVSLVAGTDVFAHFFFDPITSEKWRVRLRCPAGSENGMAACPWRMTVWYMPQTSVEAVER